MAKINISLPQELLDEIDSEADVLCITRSGLIQEASVRYITAARTDREAEIKRLRIESAAKRMKQIGTRLGLAGVDPVALIAEARAAEETRHEG
ncbi:MAG: hypothetical protein HGA39_03080 [Coriobacteriia bacterium]|nr:hypothetical protein [Coriobacteriia bacterium]